MEEIKLSKYSGKWQQEFIEVATLPSREKYTYNSEVKERNTVEIGSFGESEESGSFSRTTE
jgi:hypothetical protein